MATAVVVILKYLRHDTISLDLTTRVLLIKSAEGR